MKLLSSPPSPFGRKVKIAAHLLGLMDRIDVVVTDTLSPAPDFLAANPLGKIPALVLDDGTALYDSRVIVEYLDHLAGGGRLIPAEPKARFAALHLQALADGMMDAGLVQRYERLHHAEEAQSQKWLAHQAGKVARALDQLEANPPGTEQTAGTITLACALGYLDFRFDGAWRHGHPKLVAWLDRFAAATPAFGATAPG